MSAELANAFNFADFQGMTALKRQAAADTPEARRAVAQQFEALFLNLVLKEMRESGIDGGLLDSDRLRTYQGMYDQQLALSLAKDHSIGLADAIERQLSAQAAPPSSSVPPASSAPATSVPATSASAATPALRPRSGAAALSSHAAAAPPPVARNDFRPASAAEFVAAVRPLAEQAAGRLGVDADVLVAQAALETGWGQHQIRLADGSSSMNLFGIKATPDWAGGRAAVGTLEFIDGVPERSRASFRAYDDLAAAFDDYVAVVSSEPRYRAALTAATPGDYLRALQSGGYATDPAYADKVMGILARGLPGRTVAETATAHEPAAPGPAPQVAVGVADTGETTRPANGDEA